MAGIPPKSQSVGQAFRLPLALEVRLAAHCTLWGEPAADVIADAVELLLDGLADRLPEQAAPAAPAADEWAADAAAALAGFVS